MKYLAKLVLVIAGIFVGAYGCGGVEPAMPDAGPGDVGEEPSRCDHDFCAAFDGSEDVTIGWSKATQVGGCTYDSFFGDYRSAPRSLRLHCRATGNGGDAVLSLALPANGKARVRLEFDYKLYDYTFVDGSQAMHLFGITDNAIVQPSVIHGANEGWFVNVPHSGTNGATAIVIVPTRLPPLDTWTHATMDVTLATQGGSATLKWNDTITAAERSGFGTTNDTSLTTLGVDLRLGSIGSTSPEVTMLIDNVTVDLL